MPLTATSARWASSASSAPSPSRSRPSLGDRLRERAQGAHLRRWTGRRRASLSSSAASTVSARRAARARLDAAEDGVGAGGRDLLGHDDRARGRRKPGSCAPQRRRAADLDQLADDVRVEREKPAAASASAASPSISRAGMVAERRAPRTALRSLRLARLARLLLRDWPCARFSLRAACRARALFREDCVRIRSFRAIGCRRCLCANSRTNVDRPNLRNRTTPRPVFRFAPSPNGRLHLGHAYSALLNERRRRRARRRMFCCASKTSISRACTPRIRATRSSTISPGSALPSRAAAPAERACRRLRRGACDGWRRAAWSIPASARAARSRAASGGERDPDGAPLYPGRCRAGSRRARARWRGERAALRLDMARALAIVREPLAWREFGEGVRGAVGRRRSRRLGRRRAARQGSAGELSSGRGGRRRACRASPTSCAARDLCSVDVRPPPAAGAARTCRSRAIGITGSCSTRAARKCRKARVEVARRAARAGRLAGRSPRRAGIRRGAGGPPRRDDQLIFCAVWRRRRRWAPAPSKLVDAVALPS